MKIERLRQSGEQPFALESCYLPADEFAGLLSLPLERRSLFATLEREYGVELAYADEEVDATRGQRAHGAKLLGIHAGAPVMRIRQAHLLHRGQSHALRDRLLPVRSAYAADPPLPPVVSRAAAA